MSDLNPQLIHDPTTSRTTSTVAARSAVKVLEKNSRFPELLEEFKGEYVEKLEDVVRNGNQ